MPQVGLFFFWCQWLIDQAAAFTDDLLLAVVVNNLQ